MAKSSVGYVYSDTWHYGLHKASYCMCDTLYAQCGNKDISLNLIITLNELHYTSA